MARYVDTALRPGERILYDAQVHWAIFIVPFLRAFTVCVGLSIGWLFFSSTRIKIPASDGLSWLASLPHIWFILIIAILIGLGGFLKALIYYFNSDFVLTDRRVIAKFGLLSRTTSEQRLSKVESIHVYQSFLGRILNFGNITVTGTGSSETRFGPMIDPLACKHALEEQLDLNRDRRED